MGGHQKFQPSKLASELADLGVVNIGAAGTFVVGENIAPNKLRDQILGRLQFQPELMICPASHVQDLASGDWFSSAPEGKNIGRFVSVLGEAPRRKPTLPIERPAGREWEVRIIAATGPFVLSVRRIGQTYSNAIVEKEFGVPATTRSWKTIESICRILDKIS